MVVDTSAIIAILAAEPEREVFIRILSAEAETAMSVMTFHESSIVIARKIGRPSAAERVDQLARELRIEISTATIDDALAAREAYFRFGRGYHAARLNLADCFSYALAKARNEPLLFKGDDFSMTDIVPAWRP
jgi:ribonuclease VapC